MKSDYPRIENLGLTIHERGAIDPDELAKALAKQNLSMVTFREMFGIQTCPLVDGRRMLYAGDTEAVLERMISGLRTGTQMFWD